VKADAWAALERCLLAPAARAGPRPQRFAVTWTPPDPQLATTLEDGRGNHWLLAGPLSDPTRRNGRIPVPRAHLETLHELEANGAALDFVVIAHELPKTWKAGAPLPALVPPSPRVEQAEQIVLKTVRHLRRAAVVAGKARAIAVVSPFAALAALDPIVLGGVISDDPAVTAWAVLAAWTWDE
jgi:hypothetical protein